jgi:hypothetical protein
MGTINSNNRIAATMYSLGTLFVSVIYIYIYTLHKGDNDNDNNNRFYRTEIRLFTILHVQNRVDNTKLPPFMLKD